MAAGVLRMLARLAATTGELATLTPAPFFVSLLLRQLRQAASPCSSR